VIAGDHKQLSPIIHAPGRHPEHLRKSLFEQLSGHYPTSTLMLDVTFRMNAGVNDYPSQEFYGGELKPSACAADRKFEVRSTKCGELHDVIAREEAVTFIELNHEFCRTSDDEAELVARLAKELIQHHKIPPTEMAIIGPRKVHNENIRKKFSALVKKDSSMKSSLSWELVIDTVHRLQGQEREVVIFSLGCSDRDYLINCRELYFDPHLMNVAITRSKTRLFVVGSKYFFPHNANIIIDANEVKLWERFYNYLVEGNHRIQMEPPEKSSDEVIHVTPVIESAPPPYLYGLPASQQGKHFAAWSSLQ